MSQVRTARAVFHVVCPESRKALLVWSADGCWLPITVELSSEADVPAAVQQTLKRLARVIDLPRLVPPGLTRDGSGLPSGWRVPWFRSTPGSAVQQYEYLIYAGTDRLAGETRSLRWFHARELPDPRRSLGSALSLAGGVEGKIARITVSQLRRFLWHAHLPSRTDCRLLAARARRACRSQPRRRRNLV
jgi:hypothetical protein